jgi:hypothetical protein
LLADSSPASPMLRNDWLALGAIAITSGSLKSAAQLLQ